MRLLRDFSRRSRPVPDPAPREDMPPRPQTAGPDTGPITVPRWGYGPAFDYDPCGNGPAEVRTAATRESR